MDKTVEIWEDITNCLKEHLSGPAVQTFMSSAKPVSYEENMLTIEVPNIFSKEWMKDKCEPIIREKLPELDYSVIFEYIISKPEPINNEQLSIFKPVMKPNRNPQFNPKYTFDNFIVGHNNRFAYAAAQAVVKSPAKSYNPLFIYGSVGLGKTHILHAVGLDVADRHPDLKIKLVSCEKFTNDLINSIKDKKTDSFRETYRSVDILIVDDIQFLAGKEQTQEEFFHTFNDLYNLDKQIILTSDRSPKEIQTLEDRLRTRFEWGLIADIQPPELETRIAILRKKMEINEFEISDDILHYIATQIPTNVREMEGALTRIVAYASLLDTNVTLSIASNVIRDMVGIKQEKPLTISQIQRKTAEYFSLSTHDLSSKGRTKEVAYARQIAMYLSRELTNLSLPKIGENFGNRDHSTVMHANDKIKTLLTSDEDTKNIINFLITTIKNDH
jgi:chromosomal replication initiator protein